MGGQRQHYDAHPCASMFNYARYTMGNTARRSPPAANIFLSPRRPALLITLLLTISCLSIFDLTSSTDARQLHRICCSPSAISTLASLSAPQNLTQSGATLAPFLIPRVSGSEGNIQVQQHILATFKSLNWHVEEDRFNETTPYGVKPFNNIVVTKHIGAPRKLILAAHFDSKYFKDFDFIGATDSAVPCAILVDVAKTLNHYLESLSDPFTTLQLIFFDGEEAFVTWTATDSLYGSRHLAAKWESTYVMNTNVPTSGPSSGPENSATNILQTIDVMILLDLLGMRDTRIWNTHQETAAHWSHLVDVQRMLATFGLLSNNLMSRLDAAGNGGYFMATSSVYSRYQIEDDHKPFMERGVPIVHVIPQQFPSVWHKEGDNGDAVDPATIQDYALIFRVFVAEYLGLQIT